MTIIAYCLLVALHNAAAAAAAAGARPRRQESIAVPWALTKCCTNGGAHLR